MKTVVAFVLCSLGLTTASTPALAASPRSAARQVIRILSPKGLARGGVAQQTGDCLATMRRLEERQAAGRLATLLTIPASLAAYVGATIHFNAQYMPLDLATDQVFYDLAHVPSYGIGALTIAAFTTTMVGMMTRLIGRGGLKCPIPELKPKNVAEMEQLHARALLAAKQSQPVALSAGEESTLRAAAAALDSAR